MTTSSEKVLPRNQSLPLFNPHMPDFVCQVEVTKVPPIDAQADAWFLEARELESPLRLDRPDYKKVVQLTRQAAERHHWKAMLNLATYYLEGRDPPHSVEDAVRLVEEAMRLGIPAAYDRMGIYHMNGTGVRGDATRAYAFWQKAAEMGNPQAMSYLGEKLRAYEDRPGGGLWANIPVAIKMMECALGQGFGEAAYNLAFEYTRFPKRAATREEKARALSVLHQGVKLGCEDCANKLQIEFSSFRKKLDNLVVPHPDKARSERYGLLGDALGINPDRRFPNLDKVLPLPPADLPPWNGDRDTLLAAAMGVSLPLSPPPKPSAASQYKGRHFLDGAYALRHASDTTSEACAPVAGYWRPTAPEQSERVRAILAPIPPGLYQQGEVFEHFNTPPGEGYGPIQGIVWEYSVTIRHNQGAVEPISAAGITRVVPRPEPLVDCITNLPCPVSGIWQPWIAEEHPLRCAVNQPWRQTWLRAGQAFPHPLRDWPLDLSEQDVRWYLMDASSVNINS